MVWKQHLGSSRMPGCQDFGTLPGTWVQGYSGTAIGFHWSAELPLSTNRKTVLDMDTLRVSLSEYYLICFSPF